MRTKTNLKKATAFFKPLLYSYYNFKNQLTTLSSRRDKMSKDCCKSGSFEDILKKNNCNTVKNSICFLPKAGAAETKSFSGTVYQTTTILYPTFFTRNDWKRRNADIKKV